MLSLRSPNAPIDFRTTWGEVHESTVKMLEDPRRPAPLSFQGISRRVYKLVTSAEVINIPPHPQVTASSLHLSQESAGTSRLAAITIRHLLNDCVWQHIQVNVLPRMKEAALVGHHVHLLRTHNEAFERLMTSAQLLTASFNYLTHFWKQNDSSSYTPKVDCIKAWLEIVYYAIRSSLVEALLSCVDDYWRDRPMEPCFTVTTGILAKLSQPSHRPLAFYCNDFETPFLKRAFDLHDSLSSEVLAKPDISLKDKIDRIIAIVKRASTLSTMLEKSSIAPLKAVVVQTCVDNHIDDISASFDAWLAEGNLSALHQLYFLVRESERGLVPLLAAFELHVVRAGEAAIQQARSARPDGREFVAVVSRVHAHYRDIVVRAFQSNSRCMEALMKGLATFVNKNEWVASSVVAAELCARYFHATLRAGGGSESSASGSPASTASVFDTDADGGVTLAPSTVLTGGVTTPQLTRAAAPNTNPIDDGVLVFCLLRDRDVFQYRYAEYLAARLLILSPNLDAERTVIGLLMGKSSHEFTYRWSRMIHDYEAALATNDGFQSHRQGLTAAVAPPLNYRGCVVAHMSWPMSTVESVPMNIAAVSANNAQFESWYRAANPQRRLQWNISHSHGTVVPKPAFYRSGKSYEFVVSWPQLAVLFAFGAAEGETKTLDDVIHATGLSVVTAIKAVQQLIAPRCALLQCSDANAVLRTPIPTTMASSSAASSGGGGIMRSASTVLAETTAESAFAVAIAPLLLLSLSINEGFTSPSRKINLVPGATVGTSIATGSQGSGSTGTTTALSSAAAPRVEDRRFAVQSAIIRIMKSRKLLSFGDLVLEVIALLQGKLFTPTNADVKNNIDWLIEKDYLERDATDTTRLKYVA